MRWSTPTSAIKALLDVPSQRKNVRLLNAPNDIIKTHLVGNAYYKMNIPDRKEWERDFGLKHWIIWFSNGSKTKDDVEDCARTLSMRGITRRVISIFSLTLSRYRFRPAVRAMKEETNFRDRGPRRTVPKNLTRRGFNLLSSGKECRV